MFEYMDEIVEGLQGFWESVEEWAEAILLFFIKATILITTPIWILPYVILRDRNGGKCENQDCENCPFPPCEKGECRL